MQLRDALWLLSMAALIGFQIRHGGVSTGGQRDWVLTGVDAVATTLFLALFAALITTGVSALPIGPKRYRARWEAFFPGVFFAVTCGMALFFAVDTGGPVPGGVLR